MDALYFRVSSERQTTERRELLTRRVEVDECYVGGLEEGLPGRLNLEKALVVVAAQEDGPGIGRIRMRQISDASAESLVPFVQQSVESGSTIHTDGWLGYLPSEKKGYEHQSELRIQRRHRSVRRPGEVGRDRSDQSDPHGVAERVVDCFVNADDRGHGRRNPRKEVGPSGRWART